MLKKVSRIAPFLFFFVIAMTDGTFATKLLHRNLKGLVEVAHSVFTGRCVSVSEGIRDLENGAKLYYTEYTFEVEETLKGHVGRTVTFRQFGWASPRQIDDTRAIYPGIMAMPNYREGEDYLLFLIGESRLGLTSPAGLNQGAFLVEKDQDGLAVAANAILNRGLFRDISSVEMDQLGMTGPEKQLCTFQKGPLPIQEFKSVVKKFIDYYR
ncbi:hypothetical protein MJD09_24390 [bacterium]|nr:hypothetical protein [bacterium]